MSKIEWTGQTWNVGTGCTKIASECKNCYAIPMSHRLAGIKATAKKYEGVTEKTSGGKLNFTGKVNFDEEALLKPLKRKKPTTYFVNSMSDLFHEGVTFQQIDKMFAVMALCPQHTFQILTKRADRMREYFTFGTGSITISEANIIGILKEKDESFIKTFKFPLENVWLGVSGGTQASANKLIPDLLACPAKVRFLSCEPLLENIELGERLIKYDHNGNEVKAFRNYLEEGIHWVIVGGESGHGARPTHPDWVRSIRDQCEQRGTAFFFKQWGEWLPVCQNIEYENIYKVKEINGFNYCKVGKHASGRLLDGVEYNEMPQS
jgi:protein gp37